MHGIARSHEYPVVHERKILFVNGEYWVICDVLTANDSHDYELLFHLAASAQGRVSLNSDAQCFTLDAPHLVMLQPIQPSVTVSVEEGYLSSTYGVKQQAPVIKFTQQGAQYCFYTVLYPYKNERPSITLSSIPVVKDDVSCNPFTAYCLSIAVKTAGQIYTDRIFVANGAGQFKVDDRVINTPVFLERKVNRGNGSSSLMIHHRIHPKLVTQGKGS
ncbi:Heparinase II/III-like protein (fragment) [Crenothrix polyspora]|uniref:Heparinase II/III-like protein n=1 Tax=Crenothrix polyspora TaxID=360316 RepID=A0A1R4HBX3_9GAMM